MSRPPILIATLTLGIALVTGVALAGPAGDENAGQAFGTVRYVNRVQNLVILTNGMELRAMDPRLLQNIQEGMEVKVDFTDTFGRTMLNSIEPVGKDTTLNASPTTEGGIREH